MGVSHRIIFRHIGCNSIDVGFVTTIMGNSNRQFDRRLRHYALVGCQSHLYIREFAAIKFRTSGILYYDILRTNTLVACRIRKGPIHQSGSYFISTIYHIHSISTTTHTRNGGSSPHWRAFVVGGGRYRQSNIGTTDWNTRTSANGGQSGAVLSTTVIVLTQVLALPAESVTIQVTLVVPNG